MSPIVTLQNVAEAAEVSISTASRALRGHPSISVDSAAHVRRIASQLNYQPLRRRKQPHSVAPKSPLSGKRLAVVTLGMDRSLIALPAVSASIHGVEEAVSESGGQLQLINLPDLSDASTWLRARDLDGAFLLGVMQGRSIADSSHRLIAQLRETPSVWLLGRPHDCWGDVVGASDVRLGTLAADFLAEHGHRHVAFISPKPDHIIMAQRENGFIAQCLRHGMHVDRYVEAPPEGWQLPMKPPQTVQSVQALVNQMAKAHPRATAVFAATDAVAAVVYGALSRLGIRIGEDISLISGNNDYSLIVGMHPALTTFDIHPHEIGRLAVQQMNQRLLNPNFGPPIEFSIEPTLVLGESVQRLSG